MPIGRGGSEGITIPITAKIEGWQEQIKAIRNAMKGIDIGSDMGKKLAKELSSVEGLVTNLGKNVMQHLTSDAQIDQFTEKIKVIEASFVHLGTTMQNVSLTDLNTDYLTSNFQNLITALTEAGEALSQGISSEFQSAINESAKLQKVFSDFKINPKNLGAEELKEEITNKLQEARKELAAINKELDDSYARRRKLKSETTAIDQTKYMQIQNVEEESKRILGDMSNFEEKTTLNRDNLESFVDTMTKKLDEAKDTIKDRKEEISKLLGDLKESKDLNEATKRFDDFYKYVADHRMKTAFGLTGKDADKREKANFEMLGVPSAEEIQKKREEIQNNLLNEGIDPKIISNLLPDIDKLLTSSHWNELPQKIADIIKKAQIEATKAKFLKNQEINALEEKISEDKSKQFKEAALINRGEKSIEEIDTIITAKVQEATQELQNRVAELEKLLEEKSTEDIKNIGQQQINKSGFALKEADAAAAQYKAQLEQVQAAEQMLGKIQGVIQRWFSIYAVVRMVGNAIRTVISTVQELDKTITEISIVTNMSQDELWGQMDKYIALADKYAASISGVYQVSQLYYQQGLQSNDVMALTEQTLKMARISGLDYSEATNYMTNAIRSFKMEMTEAQTIVDVYSAIAATSATSTAELASAMSKTASSAQAVGASFEATTAMMAVMIEATREAPENIGSAMKSIISRYGELKENVSGVDAEGEEYSLNKVDKALQSVGISIHNAAGEFREFDDVIFELAKKWDTIDVNAQRYIATIMAGNRQQSRFLALVSSYDRLQEEYNIAMNSEDASQLQYLKTLDSVDAKIQQLQNSIQSLYVNTGVEKFYKDILDYGKSIIDTFAEMPRLFNLPIPALGKLASNFTSLALLVTTLFKTIKTAFQTQVQELLVVQKIANNEELSDEQDKLAQKLALNEQYGIQKKQLIAKQREEEAAIEKGTNYINTSGGGLKGFIGRHQKGAMAAGMAASAIGLISSSISAGMDTTTNKTAKGVTSIIGTLGQAMGSILLMPGPLGKVLAIIQLISGGIEAWGIFFESDAQKLERLQKVATETNNEYIKKKDTSRTLKQEIEELEKLEKQSYLSTEAKKEYQEASDKFAEAHPELIKGYDEENHAIIDLTAAYAALADAMRDTAEAGKEAAKSDVEYYQGKYQQAEKTYRQQTRPNTIMEQIGINLSDNAELNNIKSIGTFMSSQLSLALRQQNFEEPIIDEDFTLSNLWNLAEEALKGNELKQEEIDKVKNNYEKINELFNSINELKLTDKAKDQFEAIKEITEIIYDTYTSDILDINVNSSKRQANAAQISNLLKYTSSENQAMSLDQNGTGLDKESLFNLFSSADGLISNYIAQSFTEWKAIGSNATLPNPYQTYIDTKFPEDYASFYNSLLEWIQNSTSFDQKQLTETLGNASFYNEDVFKQQLKNLHIDENLAEEISKIYFNENTFDATKLSDWLKKNGFDANVDFTQFGETQLRAIQQTAQKFKDLQSEGQITSATDSFNEYLKIWQQLKDAPLSVQKAFANWSDYSYFGLLELSKTLEDFGADITFDDLQTLANQLPANVEIAVNSYFDKVKSEVEKFTNAISKASSGMNFDDAIKFTEEMGLELKDLTLSNGKYYFTDYEQIKDKLTGKFEADREVIEERIKQYENLFNIFGQSGQYETKTQQIGIKTMASGVSPIKLIENEQEKVKLKLLYKAYTKTDNYQTGFLGFYNYLNELEKSSGTTLPRFGKNSHYFVKQLEQLNKENYEDVFNAKYNPIEKIPIYKNYEDLIGYITDEQNIIDTLIQDENFITSDNKLDYLKNAKTNLTIENQTNIIDLFNQYYESYKNLDEETKKLYPTFSSYIQTQLTQNLEQLQEAEEYLQNILTTQQIKTGQFTKAGLSINWNQVRKGNFDGIDEQYRSAVISHLDDVHTFYSDLIGTFGDNIGKEITVTDVNKDLVNAFGFKTWEDGGITKAYIDYEKANIKDINDMFVRINVSNLTNDQKTKAKSELLSLVYKNNPVTLLSDAISNYNKLSQEQVDALHDLEGFDTSKITFDSVTGNYTTTLEYLQEYIDTLNNLSNEQKNNLKAEVEGALQKKSASTIITNIVKDYSSIGEDSILALANLLNANYNEIKTQFFIDNGQGSYKLNINEIQSLLQTEGITEATRNYLNELLGGIADSYISNINSGLSLVTKGTTNIKDIQQFKNQYKEFTGKDLGERFNYDPILKAWTLDPSVLYEYVRAQGQQLVDAGIMSGTQMTEYINNNFVKELANAIDVQSFLQAENKSAQGQAYQTLYKQLTNYFNTFPELLGNKTAEEVANLYISQLSMGGQSAVEAIKALALQQNKELSSQEIEAAFKLQTSDLEGALDQLSYGVGSVVSGLALEILQSANEVEGNASKYGLTLLDDGQTAVITSLGDVTYAYEEYYKRLAATQNATVSQLNTAQAKIIESRQTSKQTAIDLVGKSFGITYTELADTFSELGLVFTEELTNQLINQNIIKDIGGNKLNILDINKLAGYLGLDTNSPEFLAAFKSYNDSLIEYNQTKFNQIKSEIEAFSTAKGGDQINFSYIANAIGEEPFNLLTQRLGFSLRNGILSIEKGANFDALAVALNGQLGEQLDNATLALLDQLHSKREIDLGTSIQSIIQNRKAITTEVISNLADTLGFTYNEIINQLGLKGNGNGTYRTDIGHINGLLEAAKDQIADQTYKELINEINNIKDSILTSIKNANALSLQGTESTAEMQHLVDELNDLGISTSIEDAFSYDTIENTFKLNANTLKQYIEKQKEQLTDLGLSGNAIDEYIKNQTITVLQQNMDIQGFIESIGTTTEQQQSTKLVNQIRQYVELRNIAVEEADINNWMESLLKGGEQAVNLLKGLKGEDNVSNEEIMAVYSAAISRLRNVATEITSGIGETISRDAANILEAAGYTVDEIGDTGTFVIKSLGDVVAAYKLVYEQMQNNDQHTVSELNNLYADLLTANDRKNIDSIETLKNASSMSYSSFAELMNTYGMSFEEVLNDFDKYSVQATGFGTVRITDFNKFAQEMKWEIGSPEYEKNYKAYADSMAEFYNQPITRITEALDQLKGLQDVKPGEVINVSSLSMVFGNAFDELISNYGIELADGIIQLNSNINISDLIAEISRVAAESGQLIPEQLAELADTIAEMLSNITNLIKTGITGGLNNVDANTLQQWAGEDLKLDFTQTAEGLQLSELSAIQLYNKIKAIDAIQGKIVFDELSKSLQENNDNFKSISALTEHIYKISKDIYATDGKTSTARREQYQAELAIAKEILMVRSTSEDSSFNFMSNKIPGAQNNPLNYFSNWASAIQKLKSAMETSSTTVDGITHTGLIDYQDWYNIVTEMNNIAALGGEFEVAGIKLDGSLEAAAALIQKGAEALTVDSTGNIKVALGDIGVDFEAGTSEMSSGIDAGIKAMADSQVKMLDGLIAMLELIVSMEKLGDIDVDKNGIDLSDIFEVKYDKEGYQYVDFKPIYETWRQDIIRKFQDYIDKGGANGTSEYLDLGRALEGIKVKDIDLIDIIKMTPGQLKNADESVQNAYTAILTAFSRAAASGNYDLDNIYESIKQVLAESGLGESITLTIGDTTLIVDGGQITTIDWTTDNSKQLIEQVIKDNIVKNKEEALKYLQELVGKQPESYQELEYKLILQERINIEKDGTKTIKWGSNTYKQGSPEFNNAVKAWAFKDFGGDLVDDNIHDSITSTITIGDYTLELEYDAKTSQVSFLFNDEKYTSRQELINKTLEAYRNGEAKDKDGNILGEGLTDQEVLYQTLGIVYSIKTSYTKDDKAVGAMDKREALNAALNDTLTGDNFKQGPDGNYVYTASNGVVIKVSAAEIETDKKVDLGKWKEFINSELGTDEIQIDNISAGITKALQNVGEWFNNIGTTGLKDAENYFSSIAASVAELATTTLPEWWNSLFNKSDTSGLEDNVEEAKKQVEEEPFTIKIDGDTKSAEEKLETLKTTIEQTTASIEITSNIDSVISAIQAALNSLNESGPYHVDIIANVQTNEGVPADAKGNVALAAGTLMGELGPELWVSGGRYFVAGQSGAEFVNLPSDAIVFNHQQTASLLKNGKASRGKPVTNETNAISFAKGNVNGGPAMASASAALAALKQLRAQWQTLASLSAKDLAGAGGGGGGGGGGDKAFIKDLEKWYNWLQRIATLEKQINQYEAERSTIESSWVKNGYEYFKSQQQSLAALKEQVSIQADLTKSQQQYFNQRRAELNSSKNPFSSLYTFDENGQLVYKDGKLAELSKMVGSDEYRKANMSVEEQYKYITKTLGIDAKYLEYDNSGNKIEKGDYAAMVQAFWDKIDTDKNEMQSLYDSVKEGALKLEELQQQQNELLQSMRDNQMDLEQKVYDAIIDERERLIDELEETKDAIEESNQKFIDGLNEALDKERQLYEKSENQKELNKLIRQRDILMRSGGSASEIANLNEEIQQKQFDNYLAKQEEQINAIQEASDKQIEKLDAQIELENELLEYQKKYGLLWEQVTKIMEGSPNAIANFITEKNSEYWNKSPIAHEQDLNNLLFSSEQWAAFRDSDNIKLTDIQAIRDALVKEKEKGDKNSNKNGSGGGKKGGSGKKAGNNGNKNKSGNNTNDDKKRNEGKHYGYSISGPEQSNGKITIAAQERGFADEVSALIAGNMKLQNTNFPAYDKQKLHVDTFTYDKGGMVADTGMALLHAKESVLTAAQTNILRNDILGNKPDSLLSIFQTLQSAYANPGVNTYNSSNDSKTIQINKMELNLNVDKLANDYDSRQAARTVMDEMVRIASKTSANNSVRR